MYSSIRYEQYYTLTVEQTICKWVHLSFEKCGMLVTSLSESNQVANGT